MSEMSTKPYLIRAIYEWCMDSGYTPYIAVGVAEGVRVPTEYVKNGEIVLNVSGLATNRLKIGNEAIEFQARFGGVAREVYVPIASVIAVYARENGQGMAFDVPRAAAVSPGPERIDQPDPEDRLTAPTLSNVPTEPAVPSGADAAAEAQTVRAPGERPKLTRIK